MKKLLSVLFCLTLVLGITLGLASCEKVECKVDFVVDGEIYATVNTSGKETIKIPSDPVKEGYVFDGWYWDNDVWNKPFTANSLLDAPLSENMSVYAKWTSSESVQGVKAEFDGFTKISDTEYSITVSNSTEAFSLGTKVTINSKSSWTLTSDIYGNTTISSKVAPLEIGDNVYYALVTAENGQSEMYKLNIRRRPMYTVTFDTDGGTTAEAATIEEGSLVAAPDTYKKGHTLSGWSYDFTAPITKNETISAIWLANEYVITYDANGGSVAREETGVVYDINYTLEVPTRTGYSFDGWYLGNDLFENGIWKGDSDITVIAKWSLIDYEIEYDLGGGALATANPATYNVESGKITLVAPTKTGYTFLGWTGTDVATPSLTVEIVTGSIGNRSYIANWSANTYTVTLDSNGGDETYENITATFDGNVTLPTPIKNGYTFVGWFEGETPYASGAWRTDKNVDLVAKWSTDSYSIGYTLNGGSVNGTNPTTYNAESEFTLINPTKTGYTFLGWTYEGVIEPALNVTIANRTGNLNFVANFKVNEYELSFNSDGGASVADMKIEYGAEFTLPETTKTGYTFAGWYVGEDPFTAGNWTYTENKTVTAKWTAITYNINYTLSGGIVDGTNPTTYNVESEFTLINPTKTGYTFLGWTYGSVTETALNVTISASTGDLAFVAHWKAESFKIYLDAKGGTVEKNEIAIDYDDEIVLPTPELAGHTFTGWFDGTKYITGGKYNLTTDMNLIAVWDLVLYDIQYNLNGGTVDGKNPNNYTIESEFTLINPTKAGYTFLGWTYEGVAEPALNVTISDRTGNISFVANFKANTNTPYKVEYYFENSNKNGYDILNSETENLAGTTDTTASITPKSFEHFKFNSSKSTTSGNIDGEGTLVLKVYYDRNSYTVTTSAENTKGGSVTLGATKVYGNEITITATVKAGYTWLGWYEGNALVSGDLTYTFMPTRNISLVAKWSANEDTFYTVEYYHQNIDNNDYSLIHSDILMGTTDTLATATINSYPHFTYYAAISNASGNIDGEGDAVLKIYYTRSSYTVTTRAMNAKAGSVTSGSAYRYGKTITVTATTNPGYTFLGWYVGNTLVCEIESYKFTVENNVTLTAKWSANDDTKYTVEYYLENKNKTRYDKVDTVVLEGITDTTANAVISDYEHFTFTSANSVISGNIAGNGTLVLKVYYTRDVYTINSAVENGKAGTVTSGGNYAYENSVSLVASSNPGYTFLGWYEGAAKVCDTLTFTFNTEKNVTYTAKWSADDATYTVNYYKKTFTKTGYVVELYDSVILNSKTGELVEAIDKGLDAYTFDSSASTMSGEVFWDNSLVLNVWYAQTYLRDGNYIYFGEYPQSLKDNDVEISNVRDNRGYYLGSDGFYYAKVVANHNHRWDSYDSFSNGEAIVKGNTYYFRVEPIRWRILTEINGELFILCDSIIDCHVYDEGNNNNYELSDIRKWLNNTFYSTAFETLQAELIKTTNVDNSLSSTGDKNNSNVCNNTNDKVFLLSYQEVTNESLGFATDTDRKMKESDYAIVMGVDGWASWALRSPSASYRGYIKTVIYTGTAGNHQTSVDGGLGAADFYENGVVPAMWIKL